MTVAKLLCLQLTKLSGVRLKKVSVLFGEERILCSLVMLRLWLSAFVANLL